MFEKLSTLFFACWAPYYIYVSLKREKLTHKLSGIGAAMIAVFVIVGTKWPIYLKHTAAFGLLGIGIAIELIYLAYKEKNPFACLSGCIVAVISVWLFLQPYLQS